MKKNIILLIAFVLISTFAIAEISGSTKTSKATTTAVAAADSGKCTIETYKGKTYIFDGNVSVSSCDAVGNPDTSKSIIAYKGWLFTVEQLNNCDLVIRFLNFKDTSKLLKYNFKAAKEDLAKIKRALSSNVDDTVKIKYYKLKATDFAGSCSPYTSVSKWD